MISDIVATLDIVLGAMFIAASIYGLITMLRSQRSSPEEFERANMRSCPWPTILEHLIRHEMRLPKPFMESR